MNLEDLNSRISQIINLYNCALADGKFADSEKKLLIEIAKRFEIDLNSIYRIIFSENELHLELPKTREEKMQHIIDLVFMMMIDCKITNNEKDFCKSIVLKLGYSVRTIDYLISKILKDIKVNVDGENFEYDEKVYV